VAGTVVVPLDGSEQAEQAVPIAQALAQRNNAPIVLLSVVEIALEFDAWLDASMVSLEDEMQEWVADRREYLDGIAARIGGSNVTTEIRAGTPSHEIAGYVEDVDDPVIVMASHGRGGIEQMIVGSVAFRVIHDVRCPILVTRISEGRGASADASFNKLLIPVDGSEFSESIIGRALATVGDPRPAVHLLRVMEEPTWSRRSFNHGLVGQYLEATRQEAEQHLTGLAEQLSGQGHEATWEVRNGDVTEEILKCAADAGASEVAMATHGRGGLGRALLGSVAQRVLQRGNLPLLLIRPQEK
jgi:nucleotide-binding universal stress UspA family protein